MTHKKYDKFMAFAVPFFSILTICRQAISDSRADFLSYGFRLS